MTDKLNVLQELEAWLNTPESEKHLDQFLESQELANDNTLYQKTWNVEGKQLTLLRYLISLYQEPDLNGADNNPKGLLELIKYVIKKSGKNVNMGQPLHQVIREKKWTLLSHIKSLPEVLYDYDSRDVEGKTLLAQALMSQHGETTQWVIGNVTHINEASEVPRDSVKVEMSPLFQAIYLNMPEAVSQLLNKGAQLDDTLCGNERQHTPLMLAVRMGHDAVVEALLKNPVSQLQFDWKNAKGFDAMGLTCERLARVKSCDRQPTLKMAAMLLCHGGIPPTSERLKAQLVAHKEELLTEIGTYLKAKPELVLPLVQRCHAKDDPLHAVVYANNAVLGGMFRHVAGKPLSTDKIVETWVRNLHESNKEALNESPDLLKFALFDKIYHETFTNKWLGNPWSDMRWRLSSGELTDWASVDTYATKFPKSRTAQVVIKVEAQFGMAEPSPEGASYEPSAPPLAS